jgi:hypothetical protein
MESCRFVEGRASSGVRDKNSEHPRGVARIPGLSRNIPQTSFRPLPEPVITGRDENLEIGISFPGALGRLLFAL